MGVRDIILADAAAQAVVTQKILDADPDNMVNSVSIQELREAQINTVCSVNSNAHEDDEWPVHPIPTCQRADDSYLEDMEKMLIEGTWPDEGEGLTKAKAPVTMHPLQPLALGLPSNQLACVQLRKTICKHETYQHH